MPLEIWIGFAVASLVLLSIPGPTVMLVISYALGSGRSTAWATVPGVALGDFTALTLSLLGAGAVLAASATLFTMLKLAGAAYLIWLGIKLWRAEPAVGAATTTASSKSSTAMFWSAFVVTALNPKSIVFFIAFVPQFVSPAQPLLPQFVTLVVTFLILAVFTNGIWALLAGEMRARFRSRRVARAANRLGASFLIGAGALTALARRSS
jgi:threonine/homoserine/homoserine lactone efflux protein